MLHVTVDRLLWLEMLSGTAAAGRWLAGSNSGPADRRLDKKRGGVGGDGQQ